MTTAELSAILYYADFLSLQSESKPITDTCKYFYIHGIPINAAYIAGVEPTVDYESKYYTQALLEYQQIKEGAGEDGIMSYIEDIGELRGRGAIDAEQLLKYIHRFSSKKERKQAFDTYKNWKYNQTFTHIIKDDDGNPQEVECSKYVYHYERSIDK